MFHKFPQPIEVLEAEMLNGQKMQGPRIAKQVHLLLQQEQKEQEYVCVSIETVLSKEVLTILSKLMLAV